MKRPTRLGRTATIDTLREYYSTSPELSSDHVDAAWEEVDVGKECGGGENPTLDPDIVEEPGNAMGLTDEASEPLQASEKIEAEINLGGNSTRLHRKVLANK